MPTAQELSEPFMITVISAHQDAILLAFNCLDHLRLGNRWRGVGYSDAALAELE
jgi:hypothetical protein